MKLLQESPVEFLAPLSKPPEKVYVTTVDGDHYSVVLAGTEQGLLRVMMNVPLEFLIGNIRSDWNARAVKDSTPFESVAGGIRSYFTGTPGPIRAAVQPLMITPFTLEVHRILARIPHGATLRYGEVAEIMGKPGAARAVGSACGRNPVLLVVPCHRVVAANGLGGFGAGLDIKKTLLRLEHVLP